MYHRSTHACLYAYVNANTISQTHIYMYIRKRLFTTRASRPLLTSRREAERGVAPSRGSPSPSWSVQRRRRLPTPSTDGISYLNTFCAQTAVPALCSFMCACGPCDVGLRSKRHRAHMEFRGMTDMSLSHKSNTEPPR